jgi:hypothetical protein
MSAADRVTDFFHHHHHHHHHHYTHMRIQNYFKFSGSCHKKNSNILAPNLGKVSIPLFGFVSHMKCALPYDLSYLWLTSGMG